MEILNKLEAFLNQIGLDPFGLLMLFILALSVPLTPGYLKNLRNLNNLDQVDWWITIRRLVVWLFMMIVFTVYFVCANIGV